MRPPLPESAGSSGVRERLAISIQGAVQGVGFRPFVHRLATELRLTGWVRNDPLGVALEVEGQRPALEALLARVRAEAPPHARIHALEHRFLPAAGFARFEIRPSQARGARAAVPLPDLATCPECLAEVLDPRARRFRHPFANCTRCGPRFTILLALPYDRPNTTMRGFAPCPACRAEYDDPQDRRFHAQPIACPRCGPRLTLQDAAGAPLATGDDALRRAAHALGQGRIVALKGLGGFQLLCDAADAGAIARLRARKPRLEKPLALLVADLAGARALCEVSDAAARSLASPETPIVLLPRRPDAPVASGVAPGYPTLGVMLPATPLHHLLAREAGRPLVATSGNLADEPIATDNGEARARLGGIADLWLVHDRPIERHMDDSVAWIVDGGLSLVRRARGYAPLPVRVARPWPPILAVGAQLKSTIALSLGRDVYLSQHIGDLETPGAVGAFERVIADFLRLFGTRPVALAHDLHPDYVSTRWAARAAAGGAWRRIAVQHHHAHLAACLAEHGLAGPALGITWDGTGYGADGTVWGGEFLRGDARAFERVAHLRRFRLPGGEAAVREPRRTALALLWELCGAQALERDDLAVVRSFPRAERGLLGRMIERGVNTPWTTSAGRLFDAVAALIGLFPRVTFEGQAAAALEFAADPDERAAYPVRLARAPARAAGALAPHERPGAAAPLVVDWGPLVSALLDDLARGVSRPLLAARFHNALVEAMAAVAREVGERRVALTGGCFQNRLLTERATARLAAQGHEVRIHRLVPPNDGGISLGQAAVAAAQLAAGEGGT